MDVMLNLRFSSESTAKWMMHDDDGNNDNRILVIVLYINIWE